MDGCWMFSWMLTIDVVDTGRCNQ